MVISRQISIIELKRFVKILLKSNRFFPFKAKGCVNTEFTFQVRLVGNIASILVKLVRLGYTKVEGRKNDNS